MAFLTNARQRDQHVDEHQRHCDYTKVRAAVIRDARPALMMQVVNQMIRPEILVEIEIVAARADNA
jgi:enamine deaminase RidA (YjgF/YER057c/UK114 family)